MDGDVVTEPDWQPPDFRNAELDFSEFHPLDHSLWDCEGYPGGKKRHLAYRWEFQWSGALARRMRCPLGLHRYATAWYRGKQLPPECCWCRRKPG